MLVHCLGIITDGKEIPLKTKVDYHKKNDDANTKSSWIGQQGTKRCLINLKELDSPTALLEYHLWWLESGDYKIVMPWMAGSYSMLPAGFMFFCSLTSLYFKQWFSLFKWCAPIEYITCMYVYKEHWLRK